MTKGFAARETADASARAKALAEKTGDFARLRVLLFVAYVNAHSSGNYPASGEVADQMLDVANRDGNPEDIATAHLAQLATRLYRGDLVGAENHFNKAGELFSTHGLHQISEIRSPGIYASTFGHAGWNAWVMGRAETARKRLDQAVARSRENNSPYELAWAEYMSAYLEIWLGDLKTGEATAAHALSISSEHGFPVWAAMSSIALGRARAELSNAGDGVSMIRRGMSSLIETGSEVKMRHYQSLAEAQVMVGAIADALSTIERAVVANPEELFMRPETFRLRGEILLKHSRYEDAEADFRTATTLARSMSGKMLELRATTSLARLLRNTERRAEARAMLADIYNRFTEGFDTGDLIDAKALLDELKN